jgi:hypothetical protein
MIDTPILQLNERWRIAHDNWKQWIIQVRKGRNTDKSSGWRGMSFCTERTNLLRDIKDQCGDVDPDAMAVIMGWPEKYRDYLKTQKKGVVEAPPQ